MSERLSDLHLAELHALAAEREIPGYRLLRREELVEALGGDAEAKPEAAERPEPASRAPAEPAARAPRERARRGGRRRERLAPERDEEREPAETRAVSGVIELTRQRHAFLRAEGYASRPDDVYVSASQVKRCELRPGDLVSGPARAPHRGERHPALVHVDAVNGGPPPEEGRPAFDELTPEPPARKLELGPGAGLLARAADLLAPLAHGQRVLVGAAPRAGRTTLLRELAAALAPVEGTDVIVLLIDERPEEVPGWRSLPGQVELALAPADLAPREQLRIAELALERARRLAESGRDAVLLCDSLTRLAVAAEDVAEVKRLFGSGRELGEEGAGSLTVIATALAGGEDGGRAERAVATTETARIVLDPVLAADGVAPALRFAECEAVGEAEILGEERRAGLRELRSALRDLAPEAAAGFLRERIEGSASNAELLAALAG